LLRSDLKLAHVRRARRTLATAATCAGVALGIVVTTGVAAASPISLPDAAASTFAAPAFRSVQAVTTSPTLEAVVGDADAALTRAQTTLSDAATVESDITTAGLPLSVGDTSVDTSALQTAVVEQVPFEPPTTSRHFCAQTHLPARVVVSSSLMP